MESPLSQPNRDGLSSDLLIAMTETGSLGDPE